MTKRLILHQNYRQMIFIIFYYVFFSLFPFYTYIFMLELKKDQNKMARADNCFSVFLQKYNRKKKFG